MRRPDPAARLRATAVALLTPTLAVGGHALAGGAPSGAGIALLAVLAGSIGVITASRDRGGDGAAALVAALASGQVLGHLVLAAAGHTHAGVGVPAPAMVGAHAAAVVVGACLIAAGGRFCRVLSTVLRTLTAQPSRAPRSVRTDATTSDQPMQSLVLLATSLSHRGPPVSMLS